MLALAKWSLVLLGLPCSPHFFHPNSWSKSNETMPILKPSCNAITVVVSKPAKHNPAFESDCAKAVQLLNFTFGGKAA